MLRIHTFTHSVGLKHYFTEGLENGGDYYLEGEESAGVWFGEGAKRLGLSGAVTKEAFFRLTENRNPTTGERLTQRTKANRRSAADFNFNASKSVSIMALVGERRDIVDRFNEAVQKTLTAVEQEVRCRVRKGGKNEDRVTGNMIAALFQHLTTRPQDGIPDNHLHLHAVVLNATYDRVEGAWKAAQLGAIKELAPEFQRLFHAHLREGLEQAGYKTYMRGGAVEIEGVPQSAIEKFSRRTSAIERASEKRGITDAKEKAAIGAKTREKKTEGKPLSELRDEWLSRLTPEERVAIENIKPREVHRERAVPKDRQQIQPAATREARKAVAFAVQQAFERNSIVPEMRLLSLAAERADGEATVDEIRAAYKERQFIKRDRQGRTVVTTPEVLQEEQTMIAFARDGRGRCGPLLPATSVVGMERLNPEQALAFQAIAKSSDRVTMLYGGAGTGKTTVRDELAAALERNGTRVLRVSPAPQVNEGNPKEFKGSTESSFWRLLHDSELQKSVKGQVLWIDDADRVGARSLAQALRMADEQKARVVLSGDLRKQSPMERGDALRILAREAGVRPVELKAVQRQRGAYKDAVASLAAGRTDQAWDRLQKLGAIQEMPQAEAYAKAASEYAKWSRRGHNVLAVAAARSERDRVNESIRKELREAGRLKGKERTVRQLQSLGWTESERRDGQKYERGQVVSFFRPTRGFGAGEETRVLGRDRLGNVWVKGKAGPMLLKTSHADRFDVYEERPMGLARGERIQITRNGKTVDGRHLLRTGATYQVKGFVPLSGDVILNNGWIVPRQFGHMQHGYCVTTAPAQRKVVDRVLLVQGKDSLPATSKEQFYAALSRCKESATVLTTDMQALRRRVMDSSERTSATELERNDMQRQYDLTRTLQQRKEQHYERELV